MSYLYKMHVHVLPNTSAFGKWATPIFFMI